MCYYVATHFSTEEIFQLEHEYVVKWVEPEFRPFLMANGFAHPSLPLITADNQFRNVSWGLIASWIRDARDAQIKRKGTLNARSETLDTLASFKGPVRNGKFCVIPVKGFYEWRHEGKEKIPYYIHPKTAPFFHIAGLYEDWADRSAGSSIRTFTMVTTMPNARMAWIHNSKESMPAILSPEHAKHWLDNTISFEEKKKLLVPYDESAMCDELLSRDELEKRRKSAQ